MRALAFAPLAVFENNQALLLCSYQHNRRAWLFSQNAKGAKASTILYSIVECTKANGLVPYDYIVYLLEAFTHPVPDIG
jgi:transposase